jgi:hypothetical protein
MAGSWTAIIHSMGGGVDVAHRRRIADERVWRQGMTTQSRMAAGSRLRVARTRGALSGLLLVVLGAWAALVPFIGPYFDFAYTPAPNLAWMWTAERGYMEVAPGVAAVVGGLILLFSTSRVMAIFGAWLGIASGAWLILGPPLAGYLRVDLGQPDPASDLRVRTLESLFFFYATGAAILFVASFALGRMSTHSVRDVRAAERRAAGFAASQERVEPAPITARDTVPPADSVEPVTYERERVVDAGAYERGRVAEPAGPEFAPGRVATDSRLEPDPRVATREKDIPESSER